MIKVIDKVLDPYAYKNVHQYMMGDQISWSFTNYLAFKNTNQPETFGNPDSKLYQFTHTFYHPNFGITGRDTFLQLKALMMKIEPCVLLEVRAVNGPRTKEPTHHDKHVDFAIGNKTAIYYVNTCNGYTEFDDGTRVDSVGNRMVVFDGDTLHNGVTCTDENARVIININFMPVIQLSSQPYGIILDKERYAK